MRHSQDIIKELVSDWQWDWKCQDFDNLKISKPFRRTELTSGELSKNVILYIKTSKFSDRITIVSGWDTFIIINRDDTTLIKVIDRINEILKEI